MTPEPNALTLTIKEAAALLGVSKSKMYEFVKQRKLPDWCRVVQIGRRVTIARAPLMAYLDLK